MSKTPEAFSCLSLLMPPLLAGTKAQSFTLEFLASTLCSFRFCLLNHLNAYLGCYAICGIRLNW